MKHVTILLTLGATLLTSAQAATYQTVATENSVIGFSYKQMGVPMEGQFKKFSAQVSLNTKQLDKAQGRIEIDLSSIDTGSSEADQEVVGKAWFNVPVHPKALFVLKSLKSTGTHQYEATGQLTLKGQTREMRTPLTLSPQGLLSGRLVMKRADFGIGEGLWAKFDVVANEITVHFNLNLK